MGLRYQEDDVSLVVADGRNRYVSCMNTLSTSVTCTFCQIGIKRELIREVWLEPIVSQKEQ